MTDADKQAFVALVTGLASIKPGGKLTKESHAIWWEAMRTDWSIDEFRAAAARLARSVEFMPSPFHFEQLRKAMRPIAAEAWIVARGAIQSCRIPGGYGMGGTCGDPLIDRAVQTIGGYQAIAMCELDKLGFLERRFSEHYESLQDTEETREALPQLAGYVPRKALQGPRVARDLLPKFERQNPPTESAQKP